MSAIWATRRSWRPPSNGVASQSSRISLASPEADDAPAHGQHVGVVVLPAHAGGVQVVAQRGAHAVDLVGGDLLALPGAAEDDAAVGLAGDDGAARRPRRSAGSRPTRCRGCRGRSASWPSRTSSATRWPFRSTPAWSAPIATLMPSAPAAWPSARAGARATGGRRIRPRSPSSSAAVARYCARGAADRVLDVVGVVVPDAEEGVAPAVGAEAGEPALERLLGLRGDRRASPSAHELLQRERLVEEGDVGDGHLAHVLPGHREDEVGRAEDRTVDLPAAVVVEVEARGRP